MPLPLALSETICLPATCLPAEVVRFHAGQLLGGHWEPYPIDMAFAPPCMVLSTIGLSQPGKIERGARAADCTNHLHQLHCCLPSTPGRTKLLYRYSKGSTLLAYQQTCRPSAPELGCIASVPVLEQEQAWVLGREGLGL